MIREAKLPKSREAELGMKLRGRNGARIEKISLTVVITTREKAELTPRSTVQEQETE